MRDNHEMGRARARNVRCRHDSGNNKAASHLLLGFIKVSSSKDYLNRKTCEEILLCLHLVTSQMVSSAGPWVVDRDFKSHVHHEYAF